MRRIVLIMGIAALFAGCSSVGDRFSAAEKELIDGEGVMRVLKSDEAQDLEILRMKSEPLSKGMLRTEVFGTLCSRMLETVKAPENDGVGIAAPQVGISRRLVAVQRFDKEGEPFEFYINPEIVRYSPEVAPGDEGCLSVPELRGKVERSLDIDVQYMTADGRDTVETVKGFTAVIFQHEIDHLDGILYTDKAYLAGNRYMETRIVENGGRITWIQDNAQPRLMPRGLFPDASDALIKELGLEEGIPSSVSVFLLEKDGARILFDAGNGLEDSRLPEALKARGLGADDIDYVYVTHLHGDHIGGMLNGAEAAFPRAAVYVSKAEYDGWMAMPEERNAQVRALASAYEGRFNLFDAGAMLPGDVRTIAAYGHTPGHIVYNFGYYLVVGDIMHGLALQKDNPEVCAGFDMDKKAAVASRKEILKIARENGLFMCGMHFPAPGMLML